MTAPLQIDAKTFLPPGEPAPNFIQRRVANPRYALHSAAGQYLVLYFFGGAVIGHAQALFKAANGRPDIFNDDRGFFFDVSTEPEEESSGRAANRMLGYRHFWEFDLLASRLYGVMVREENARFIGETGLNYRASDQTSAEQSA